MSSNIAEVGLSQLHPSVTSIITSEDYSYATGTGSTTLFVADRFESGEDNVIKHITSTDEFIAKYGKPNYKKYGQAAYNIIEWLNNGGDVYVLRVLPDDATYQSAFFNVRTKIREDAKKIINSNSEIVTVDDIFLEPVVTYHRVNNYSKEVLNNELKIDRSSEVSLDGFVDHFLFCIRAIGRGSAYNLGFRITPNASFDSMYSSKIYNFEIVAFDNSNNYSVIEGPFYVSFNPDEMSESNESMFIESVVNRYSQLVRIEFNTEAYLNVANIVNPDVDPYIVDVIGGQTRVIEGVAETYFNNELNVSEDIHFLIHSYNDNGLPIIINNEYKMNIVNSDDDTADGVVSVSNKSRIKDYNSINNRIRYIKQAIKKLNDKSGYMKDIEELVKVTGTTGSEVYNGTLIYGVTGDDTIYLNNLVEYENIESGVISLFSKYKKDYDAYKAAFDSYDPSNNVTSTLVDETRAAQEAAISEQKVTEVNSSDLNKLLEIVNKVYESFNKIIAYNKTVDILGTASDVVESALYLIDSKLYAIDVTNVENQSLKKKLIDLSIDADNYQSSRVNISRYAAISELYTRISDIFDSAKININNLKNLPGADDSTKAILDAYYNAKNDDCLLSEVDNDLKATMGKIVYAEDADELDIIYSEFYTLLSTFTYLLNAIISYVMVVTNYISFTSAKDSLIIGEADGGIDTGKIIVTNGVITSAAALNITTSDNYDEYKTDEERLINANNALSNATNDYVINASNYYINKVQDYSYPVALSGGSEGSFEEGATDRNININNALISAYTGLIDGDLLNRRLIEFDHILDNNYPVEVKNAIVTLADSIRKDFFFWADTTVLPSAEEASNWRTNNFNISSQLVGIFSQSFVHYDSYTGKDVRFTAPYYLASKIPYNAVNYGLQFPIAGPRRGLINGYKSIDWVPNESYKEVLYNKKINYVESDARRTKLGSQSTSYSRSNPLSNINNVLTVLNIKKTVEKLVEDYQFELNDNSSISSLKYDLTSVLNSFVSNRSCESISGDVYSSEYDKLQKILRVTVSVKFSAVIERIIISIDVTK